MSRGPLPAAPSERVSRQLLTRREAAASLGMSVDSFERHVQPYVKVVNWGRGRGAPVLVSPRELERWVRENERYAV
ncbi:MAG: hypothetical protein M3P44_16230 [Actinomycetota bacterium]|nr:hypothetical protein [Actinomycetota bacterium]